MQAWRPGVPDAPGTAARTQSPSPATCARASPHGYPAPKRTTRCRAPGSGGHLAGLLAGAPGPPGFLPGWQRQRRGRGAEPRGRPRQGRAPPPRARLPPALPPLRWGPGSRVRGGWRRGRAWTAGWGRRRRGAARGGRRAQHGRPTGLGAALSRAPAPGRQRRVERRRSPVLGTQVKVAPLPPPPPLCPASPGLGAGTPGTPCPPPTPATFVHARTGKGT